MKIVTFLTLIVSFYCHNLLARDWVQFCQNYKEAANRPVLTCSKTVLSDEVFFQRSKVLNELGSKFDDWLLIKTSVEKLHRRYQAEIDHEKNFLRWLRGDDNIESYQKRYNELDIDFEKLKKITLQEKNLQNCKTEVCQYNRNLFQHMKLEVFNRESLLADPQIEKCLEKELKKESQSPDKCRKQAYFESVFQYVNKRIDLNNEMDIIMAEEMNAADNGVKSYTIYNQIYPFKISENLYSQLIPEIYRVSDEHPDDWQDTTCRVLSKKEFSDNLLFAAEVAGEAGLFIAPFFIPPLGMANVGRVAYLAKYGLSAEKIISASTLIPIAALEATRSIDKKESECSRKQMIYREAPNQQHLEKFQSCLKDLSDEKIFVMGAMVLGVGVPIPFKAELAKGIIVVKSKADDVLTLLKPHLKDAQPVADAYFKYVAKVYQERLNLSPQEIEAFMKSSREMADRTLLFVKTKANPSIGPPDFKGGIGVVFKNKAEDLLPLEKATGVKIPKVQGEKSVEIVRLVSTDEANPNLMKDLLKEAISSIKSDSSIKNAYVYTSRIHERLYRKFGIPYEIVEKPNSRDVIMKFNMEKIQEALQ